MLELIEFPLSPDCVEKLALNMPLFADSVFPLIWEIYGDDGTTPGSAGSVILRVLS